MGNCSQFASNTNTEKKTKLADREAVLIARAITWQRDSHGLFDHDVKNKDIYTEKTYQITSGHGGVRFFRQGNAVTLRGESDYAADSGQPQDQATEELALIKCTKEAFELLPNQTKREFSEGKDTSVWLVVRSLKVVNAMSSNKGYKLKTGDIVKFGRLRFRVREIKLPSVTTPPAQSARPGGPLNVPEVENQSLRSLTNVPSCRICLVEGNALDPDNPLVAPCLCSGTMGYVHVKCLQQWLGSRLQKTKASALVETITWKTLECELCQKAYPSVMVLSDGRRYETIEIPKPPQAESFIIFDILAKENNQIKGVHIVNTSSKSYLRIGRGHEADVRLQDISVSRFHSILSVEPKAGMFLEDNASKFGTLVQVRKSLSVARAGLRLQIGRTVLEFALPPERQPSSHMPPRGGAGHPGQQVSLLPPFDINDGEDGALEDNYELRVEEEKDDDLVNSREEAGLPPPPPAPVNINIDDFFFENQYRPEESPPDGEEQQPVGSPREESNNNANPINVENS